MNPELNERLTTLLDYIGTTVKDADTFARGQAPLVAEEIVRWYVAESILGLVLAIALGAAGLWILRRSKRLTKIEDEGIAGAMILFGLGCLAVAIAMTCINANSLVRGLTQPRVIVLDYVRSLK